MRAIVTKRCEIGPRLLLIINKKLHTPVQMRRTSSTLDDHESHWQPVQSAILTTVCCLQFCRKSVA